MLLAELKSTGEVFAVKVLKKDVIVQDDDVEAAITERNVLTYGSCPFLVGLHSCFQTPVSDATIYYTVIAARYPITLFNMHIISPYKLLCTHFRYRTFSIM